MDHADPRIPLGLKLLSAALVLIVAGAVIFDPPQTPDAMRSFLLEKGYSQVRILGRDGYCGRARQVFTFEAKLGEQALRGRLCGGNLRGGTYVIESHPVP